MARFPRQLKSTHRVLTRALTYSLPETAQLESLRAAQQGFPGLYSEKTLNSVYFEQGKHLTARLNREITQLGVSNTPADLGELVAATFNTPELRPVTAAAAKLYNLQFCLESLRPAEITGTDANVARPGVEALFATPQIATRVNNEPTDETLRDWIIDSFGSVAEFRTLLINSAWAIKGDGVTWLVTEASYSASSLRSSAQSDLSFTKLAVMNTYNAGIVDDSVRSGQLSKLKQQKRAREEAAVRRQQERQSAENGAVSAETTIEASESLESATKPAADAEDNVLGTVEEAEEAVLYSDRKIVPLLGVDASMRAYLGDYGVFGKRQYLENVWSCIDWSVVAARAPSRFKPSVVFDQ
ncbi:hypothetical protein OXX69_000418 [Metschnikowia pulcherrima]